MLASERPRFGLPSPACAASARGPSSQPQARPSPVPQQGARGDASDAPQAARVAPAADRYARSVPTTAGRPTSSATTTPTGDGCARLTSSTPSRAGAWRSSSTPRCPRRGSRACSIRLCGSKACPSRCASTAGRSSSRQPSAAGRSLTAWRTSSSRASPHPRRTPASRASTAASATSVSRPTLARARVEAELWRLDYNCVRPHSL